MPPTAKDLSAASRTHLVTRALANDVDDVFAVLPEDPLTEAEAGYAPEGRAANTLRGYRSDWAEFSA
jgi:hypothetical protein